MRLVGPALLVWLFMTTGLGDVLDRLVGADPAYLWCGVLFTFAPMSLRYLRWRGLNRALGMHPPGLAEAAVHLVAGAMGLVTPGRAGEFSKVHFLRQLGQPSSRAFASVLADRAWDLLWLLAAGGGALVVHLAFRRGWAGWTPAAAGVLVAGAAVAMAAGGLLLLRAVSRRWGRRASGAVRPGVRGWLQESWEGLRSLGSGDWTRAGGWTVAAWCLQVMQGWLFARALGLELGLQELAVAVTLASLASVLPVSVAGLGSRDLTLVYLLGASGVEPSQALAFSLCVVLCVAATLAAAAPVSAAGLTRPNRGDGASPGGA